VQPTPPELEDRQLETVDLLPPPPDAAFAWTSSRIPADVLARSSWNESCPVGVDDLTYLTLTHVGFDGRFHTGEMIVNSDWADRIVEVFRRLHEARYPIEEMRVVRRDEIDAAPTGDTNLTSSFECRPATGSTGWSYHAYGLAIDINPFHNPYLKGDLVLPELASAYLDRSEARPGMVIDGDAVTTAFADIGWGWGGNWRTVKDLMHFSSTGR
jgi:D-alanyl-D-alanine carboxypeptidase